MHKITEEIGLRPAIEPLARPISERGERRPMPPKVPGESKAERRLRRRRVHS